MGSEPEEKEYGKKGNHLHIGKGAIVVPADDVAGFKEALLLLLNNPSLKKKMGEQAYDITIPYFTWENAVKVLLKESSIKSTFEEMGK